jgi:hypothetical protein
MGARRIVGIVLAFGFVGVVVQASAANQCPASELGACARIHLELMRPRTLTPVVLVAEPMRAATDRG